MLSKSLNLIQRRSSLLSQPVRNFGASDAPKRIAVTGAAGNISYAILYRIASGEFLGKNQRVILHLIDLPFAE